MPAARARRKPFVALNCAALTESLLENELFGHARGAFTGAAGARAGLIEHADGRHALPRRDWHDDQGAAGEAAARARVGRGPPHRREREPPVDVRFVAATNVDLKAAVDAGDVPQRPLLPRQRAPRAHAAAARARRGDVPLLVEHFLERYGRGAGVTGRVSPAALAALMAYAYPGNVRQLEHIIQRAVAIAQSARARPRRSPGGTARPSRRPRRRRKAPSPRRARGPSAR